MPSRRASYWGSKSAFHWDARSAIEAFYDIPWLKSDHAKRIWSEAPSGRYLMFRGRFEFPTRGGFGE